MGYGNGGYGYPCDSGYSGYYGDPYNSGYYSDPNSYYNNYPNYYYPSTSTYYPVDGVVNGTLSQPRVLTPNATFPYNGGPTNPVPLPRSTTNPTPAPIRKPAASVPLDGTLVSAPTTKQAVEKFTYAAYGEKRGTKPASSRPTDRVAEKAPR
jgi:hypothetical protein